MEKYDLSSLRVIFFGAAPGSTGAIEVAKRRTGVGSFRQGYGMTEGERDIKKTRNKRMKIN